MRKEKADSGGNLAFSTQRRGLTMTGAHSKGGGEGDRDVLVWAGDMYFPTLWQVPAGLWHGSEVCEKKEEIPML